MAFVLASAVLWALFPRCAFAGLEQDAMFPKTPDQETSCDVHAPGQCDGAIHQKPDADQGMLLVQKAGAKLETQLADDARESAERKRRENAPEKTQRRKIGERPYERGGHETQLADDARERPQKELQRRMRRENGRFGERIMKDRSREKHHEKHENTRKTDETKQKQKQEKLAKRPPAVWVWLDSRSGGCKTKDGRSPSLIKTNKYSNSGELFCQRECDRVSSCNFVEYRNGQKCYMYQIDEKPTVCPTTSKGGIYSAWKTPGTR